MTVKLKGSSDGSVSLSAPADTSPSGTDITLTLPTDAGSANQFLKNSGTAGTLDYSSMVETSTGVGIGTASPASVLHVNPSADCYVTLQPGSTDGNAGINFRNSGGTQKGYVMFDTDDNYLRFGTDNTERVRVDSNGKVGINVNNPGSYNSAGNELVLGNSGNNGGMTIVSGTSNNGHIFFADGTGTGAQNRGIIKYEHGSDAMAFNTAETERVRITSSGAFKSSTNGTYDNASSTSHEFNQSNASVYALRIEHSGTTPSGILIDYSGVTQNDTGSSFIQGEDATTFRFRFASNGGLYNYSGNNSNLCDEREKKNIEALDSTWGCLKNWELKKFHYNEDADTDDKRYGVIAQQVEQHCPELISDWIKQSAAEAVLDDDGNVVTPAKEEILRKGVKEQQMLWMAIKALQEAQTRIEALETKVAALEAAE